MIAKVGETTRGDRGRLVAFLNRVPLCQFVESADGTQWASLIKPDGRRSLGLDEDPPALYRQTQVKPYRSVLEMSGTGIPNAGAVVLRKRGDSEDLLVASSAVHHAAARWLAKHGLPVVPAI